MRFRAQTKGLALSEYLGPKSPPREIALCPARKRPEIDDKHRNTLAIFAFDPGGTTGWSLLSFPKVIDGQDLLATNDQQVVIERKRSWFHGQIDCLPPDFELGVWRIKRMLDLYPHAAVVFEDFWVRQLAVDLAPIKIISSVQQHLWEQGRRMFIQSASQAKTMATDDRLKLWKCYTRVGGLNHARDADRHALLFLRKCLGHKGIGLAKEAWPHVQW